MREFYASSAIMDFGVAIAAIFEPVYLWSIGWKLPSIILLFLISYLFYFTIAPLGATFARQKGYEHSIALSTPFLVLYYISLYSIHRNLIFVVLTVVFLALYRTFYWPGARSIMSHYSTNEEGGRTLSGLLSLSLLAVMLGPVIGGIVLQEYGFAVLFILSSVIILLSNVPMLITPEHFEPKAIEYKAAYKRMLKPEHRRKVLAHFGYGEEFISDYIWPVFLVSVVTSYALAGAVMAIAGVLTIIVIIGIGRFIDSHHRHPVLRAGVFMTALSWLSRVAALSPLGLVISQSFYRISRLTVSVSFLSVANQQARDYSASKSSLLYEMSIVVAKIITASLAIACFWIFPDNWLPVFILGALMTLFYAFI